MHDDHDDRSRLCKSARANAICPCVLPKLHADHHGARACFSRGVSDPPSLAPRPLPFASPLPSFRSARTRPRLLPRPLPPAPIVTFPLPAPSWHPWRSPSASARFVFSFVWRIVDSPRATRSVGRAAAHDRSRPHERAGRARAPAGGQGPAPAPLQRAARRLYSGARWGSRAEVGRATRGAEANRGASGTGASAAAGGSRGSLERGQCESRPTRSPLFFFFFLRQRSTARPSPFLPSSPHRAVAVHAGVFRQDPSRLEELPRLPRRRTRVRMWS